LRRAAFVFAKVLSLHSVVEMTSWLRILLLGIEFVQSGRCQTDIDDEDETEPDDDDNDENEPDDDDELASTFPPAPTSVSATSSLILVTSSLPATSIPPATIGTNPPVGSTFTIREASTAQAGTETPSNDTLPRPSPTSASPGRLSAGAKAGIGVGILLFVLLCLGIWLFEWRRRRTRKPKTESKRQDEDSTQHDRKSPRNSLNRYRRTTIGDHYAADIKVNPTNAYKQQEVYGNYSEKDAGLVLPGVARLENEQHELCVEVPTYELEGEVKSNDSLASPRIPPGQTNLSLVSPLSNDSTYQHRET
jgi:hypothetical protein